MKKILWSLGTLGVVVAPACFVVACGSGKTTSKELLTEKEVKNFVGEEEWNKAHSGFIVDPSVDPETYAGADFRPLLRVNNKQNPEARAKVLISPYYNAWLHTLQRQPTHSQGFIYLIDSRDPLTPLHDLVFFEESSYTNRLKILNPKYIKKGDRIFLSFKVVVLNNLFGANITDKTGTTTAILSTGERVYLGLDYPKMPELFKISSEKLHKLATDQRFLKDYQNGWTTDAVNSYNKNAQNISRWFDDDSYTFNIPFDVLANSSINFPGTYKELTINNYVYPSFETINVEGGTGLTNYKYEYLYK